MKLKSEVKCLAHVLKEIAMKSFLLLLGVLTGSALLGCSTAPQTEAHRDRLEDRAQVALDRFKQEDPTADKFLSNARGYAVFPTAGKGAAVVGGAYGHGVLYENGRMTGYCDLTQASVGPQIGGQEFSEMIVFQNQAALDKFKHNDLNFTANASAVVAKAGAAASAKYDNGVVVFTRSDAGLMAEASIAGQGFRFRSIDSVYNDPNMNHDTNATNTNNHNQDHTVRVEENRTNTNMDNSANNNTNQTDPNPNTNVNGGDRTNQHKSPDNSARTE